MIALALPALYTLFAWWFGTGAILFLDRLPRRTFGWSMAGATVLLVGAAFGLWISRDDGSARGALVAFTGGLIVWAWLEMTYYMGFVTGPRRTSCGPACAGPRHFGHAVMSSLYHELATVGLAAALYAATQGSLNRMGLWTFLLLWGVQVSAKLNVFLGVPNVSEEFLPDHLSFLKGFLTRKPMNPLFPVSVTACAVIVTLFVQKTLSASAGGFEATGFGILATLAALALLEHWFLVLPIPVAALWTWSFAASDRTAADVAAAANGPDALQNRASCPPHDHATLPAPSWPATAVFDTVSGKSLRDPGNTLGANPYAIRGFAPNGIRFPS